MATVHGLRNKLAPFGAPEGYDRQIFLSRQMCLNFNDKFDILPVAELLAKRLRHEVWG